MIWGHGSTAGRVERASHPAAALALAAPRVTFRLVPEPTPSPPGRQAGQDPSVQRAVALARALDDRFVDPLVGLVLPGAGDLITASAGVYLVWVAIQRGLPAVVVARMLLNLAIDMLLGAIPALGDLFDFAFKANVYNARLLERTAPGKSTRGDWVVVIGAALLFVVTLAIPVTLLVWALNAVFN